VSRFALIALPLAVACHPVDAVVVGPELPPGAAIDLVREARAGSDVVVEEWTADAELDEALAVAIEAGASVTLYPAEITTDAPMVDWITIVNGRRGQLDVIWGLTEVAISGVCRPTGEQCIGSRDGVALEHDTRIQGRGRRRIVVESTDEDGNLGTSGPYDIVR
jgi:hypothetical protein